MPIPSRKPWPLKWIALAIAVYIAAYTVVNLRYRKPGREFQPYEQLQERAGLAKAGYIQIPARVARPADPRFAPMAAPVDAVQGGLPAGLSAALPAVFQLPVEIGKLSAAPEADRGMPYAIQFGCVLPDNGCELGGAELYLKEGALCIVPDIERLPGGLLTRTRVNVIVLTVPPGTLAAGRYRATLVAAHASKSWVFDVR